VRVGIRQNFQGLHFVVGVKERTNLLHSLCETTARRDETEQGDVVAVPGGDAPPSHHDPRSRESLGRQ
jgi:hypothetical protein